MTISFPQRSHIAGLIVGIVAISSVWFVFSSPARVTTFLGGVGLEASSKGAVMTIVPADVTVAKGEEFSIQIQVTPDEDLGVHRAVVHFDTKRLQVVEIKTVRNADGTEPSVSYDNVGGVITSQNTTATGGFPKTLVTVKMRALQSLGKTTMNFVAEGDDTFAFDAQQKNILSTTEDATVNIVLQK